MSKDTPTHVDHIFILTEYTRNWPKFRNVACVSARDFASFDIYARGEYLVVRTVKRHCSVCVCVSMLCVYVYVCTSVESFERIREKRENSKKTRPRQGTRSFQARRREFRGVSQLTMLKKFEGETRRSRNDPRTKKKRETKERWRLRRDSPCWRVVGLTVRGRLWCKSFVRPLCRVLLRYNWKNRKTKRYYSGNSVWKRLNLQRRLQKFYKELSDW